jgi:hypothetical protein
MQTPSDHLLDSKQPESLPRRHLSMGLGLFPLLPLLPACGGGTGNDAEPDPTASAADAEASPTMHATAAAAMPADGSAPRKSAYETGVFQHPGLLATEADFARIRTRIANGDQPWKTWWDKLCVEKFATLDTRPYPVASVYRLDNSKFAMYVDIRRAWCLALRWKLSSPQDNRYADKAVEFLDAWANTLKEVGSKPAESTASDDHTFILMAGMQGHQWAQIGEIMRTYKGWPAASLKRFQDMLTTVFAPISSWFLSDGRIKSHANWDMASLVGAMAIGIFCDKPDLYRLAYDCYAGNNRGKLRTFGNGSIVHGVYYMHPGHFGQWEESGRDQGHSTLGISLGADVMEMAWNQGDDLYGLYNNRFLSASEYVARSNLVDENGKPYAMPYTPEQDPTAPHPALWTRVNSGQQSRNAWEPIYNHYVNRLGLAAPNVARMVEFCEPNYWGNSDDIAFPTLIHRRDPYAAPMKPPSGLTGHLHDGRVLLSWWGSAGATAYVVGRGTRANGPFARLTTVAAAEVLTFTDTPPDGVWFYQITAQGRGAPRAGSNVVRVAVPGEAWLSLPLNGPDRTGTVGALRTATGGWTAVQGQMLGGTTWGEGRNNDKALAFDGKESGLQLPPGIFANLDDFTVSMWAFANPPVPWNTCLLFVGTDAYAFMRITPRAGNGMRFSICGATANDDQVLEAPWFMPIRRWIHVAVTLRGSVGRLYVDGNEVARFDQMRLSPRQVGDQATFIGRGWTLPSFNGRIQDFRVHSGALSPAEIRAIAK